MLVSSVQISCRLDSQSRCLHYFPAAMSVSLGGTPKWRLHTGLCKFVQNSSSNIWSLGKCTEIYLEKCLLYQSRITSQFLNVIHWMVYELFVIGWQCKLRIRCIRRSILLSWGSTPLYRLHGYVRLRGADFSVAVLVRNWKNKDAKIHVEWKFCMGFEFQSWAGNFFFKETVLPKKSR